MGEILFLIICVFMVGTCILFQLILPVCMIELAKMLAEKKDEMKEGISPGIILSTMMLLLPWTGEPDAMLGIERDVLAISSIVVICISLLLFIATYFSCKAFEFDIRIHKL